MGNSDSKNAGQGTADAPEARNNEQEEPKERKFRWGPTRQDHCPKEVLNECINLREKFQNEQSTPNRHTFLLFGPTSHGKSSVAIGFLAAIEDKTLPPSYHFVADSAKSVTGEFSVKNYKLHRIIDMPGIFEASKITDENIEKIVRGKVPWVSKISTDTLGIQDQQKTARNSTVECIIIVLRYDCELTPELKRQIEVILNLYGKGELACHLVLTHLDICDHQFRDTANLPKLYDSEKVQKAVERMSKETGIPPFNISFVKNVNYETRIDHNSKLQYLQILSKVKEAADWVIETRETKESLAKEYRKQEQFFLEGYLTYREFLYFLGIIFIAILVVYFT